VQVRGTQNLQQNLRFNIYHMLICGHYDGGFSSIGARMLSGEGYKGHVFWDTEIFVLPFYLHTNPAVAKNMLLYRYNRLDKAREIARSRGFRGAMFPWESADAGDEQTPPWAKDINGKVVRIHTHQFEHHITGDIAYALCRYHAATGDEDFMRAYGYEILFETARFWASRVAHNARKNVYEIRGVIGPDEFHENVNNDAFTNHLAKWNLATAHRMLGALRKGSPQAYKALRRKLSLRDSEARRWRTIASRMKLPAVNRKKVLEQFDGYFKLRNLPIRDSDENGIPILPARAGSKDLGKTQLIKQADVIMLMHLFPDAFSRAVKQANYEFYMARTTHKSSLSTPVCSMAACEVGDVFRAYHLFNVCLRADISNLYGNTGEGMHAASLGGTYQAIVFGFAGISVYREMLSVNPKIPHTWNELALRFLWRGARLALALTPDTAKITVLSSKSKSLKIRVFGRVQSLDAGKQHTFRREEKQVYGFYY